MVMAVKAVLADDHRLFRRGLRALLQGHEEIEIVAEAENGRQAVDAVRELLPRLVIMDPCMPGLNGADATARIRAEFPDVKVIALSMHADKRFVSGMLEAGASAYLLKTCDEEELLRAISLVLEQKTYLSPEIAGSVVDQLINPSNSDDDPAGGKLSGREREILQLMAEGASAKEIGSRLNVSSRTIDSHRQHIMAKLGLFTVADLTKYAVRNGLTPL